MQPSRSTAAALACCLLALFFACAAVGFGWSVFLAFDHSGAFASKWRSSGIVKIDMEQHPVRFWIFVALWIASCLLSTLASARFAYAARALLRTERP
jgi:hypothetical protein